jgi:gluconokinase
MASASGLLNQAAGTWAFDYPLSAISDAPVSGLRGEFAAQLPELAEIPWFPALGDGACSNIGCGAVTPERIALMIGTSGAMRVVTPGLPQLPEGLWRYQIDAERGALGGALSNGGSVWEWLQKTLRLQDDTEAAFAEMHPDGHGLTVLPFLSGERAPLWEDGLTASIHGLTAATTSLDIAQAFREAVAFRFVAVRERLRAVSPSGEIIGTGAGLLASPTWVQVIASALGEPIRLVDEEEASSRGAALWACEQLGLGRIEDAPMPRTITVFSPDVAAHTAYAEAYQRQDTLLVRNLP